MQGSSPVRVFQRAVPPAALQRACDGTSPARLANIARVPTGMDNNVCRKRTALSKSELNFAKVGLTNGLDNLTRIWPSRLSFEPQEPNVEGHASLYRARVLKSVVKSRCLALPDHRADHTARRRDFLSVLREGRLPPSQERQAAPSDCLGRPRHQGHASAPQGPQGTAAPGTPHALLSLTRGRKHCQLVKNKGIGFPHFVFATSVRLLACSSSGGFGNYYNDRTCNFELSK